MIVLIGFMGAGKSTVGRMLGDELGLVFVDTDEVIEHAEGRTVQEIFEHEGEGQFRTLEKEAVTRSLGGPDAVVAVGGGAIHDPTTRAALEWHTVIHLDVTYPEAMRRVGQDPGRPLLHFADPKALFDEREPVYERVARHVIDTTGVAPEEAVSMIVASAVLRRVGGPAQINVDLGPRSYPVLIGSDIARDMAELVDISGSQQVFVITHSHLAAAAKPLIDSLGTSGADVSVLVVDEGEASKGLGVAGDLLEELARRRAHRSDLVVTFGGGVVCDLGGFVASTYHRGLPVAHVPTTLLAQVDAAVGGKTAVNLRAGKNLVGTIHQPIAVVCDVSLLRSLPEEEIRSGLAEVIKYGLILDPSLPDIVMGKASEVFDRDEDVLALLVRRSVAIKAAVVSSDEKEEGRREILNYGHTFGHAIEHVTGMRHGEAISLGMVAAAHLGVAVGMLGDDGVDRHRVPLETVGLPTSVPVDIPRTLDALKQDKKHRGNLRFVLLEAIGSARIGIEATDEQITAALRSVSG